MFNSAVLDVAIGLIVVFILLSTVCSAAREGIESLLKTRAAYCHYAIRELLDDLEGKGLAQQFFEHPLIRSLYKDKYKHVEVLRPSVLARGGDMPSYVPARSFATALIDIVTAENRGPLTPSSLRASAQAFANDHIRTAMMSALNAAGGDIERVREQLANWFDTTMDRVSGWYKRSTQLIIFVVALVVTVLLNVDALQIADTLYRDQTTRAALVAVAQQLKPGEVDGSQALQQLNTLHLPIGWSTASFAGGWSYFAKALGLLFTALGATLGAPFWFDVLNRVMVIRATVKPHEKSPEEPSQDGGQRSRGRVPSVAPTINLITGDSQALRSSQPDNDVDGCCDLGDSVPTPDDALPAATGGVSP